MRLSFASGEHADLVIDKGSLTLGSAPGNSVVSSARDVSPAHARITIDSRGAVLEVLASGAPTHLNARPIREKALLRCGDVLCLGRLAITLKADRDDSIETNIPSQAPAASEATHPPRAVLRGVSGNHFGKSVAVAGRLVVGRGVGCGLTIDETSIAQRHAQIEDGDRLICMRELDGNGGVLVNGILTRNAILYSGDQLTFGRSQFVIEAPGYPARGESRTSEWAVTEPHAVVPADENDLSSDGQGGMWWLIGVAALLALGLAFLINHGV